DAEEKVPRQARRRRARIMPARASAVKAESPRRGGGSSPATLQPHPPPAEGVPVVPWLPVPELPAPEPPVPVLEPPLPEPPPEEVLVPDPPVPPDEVLVPDPPVPPDEVLVLPDDVLDEVLVLPEEELLELPATHVFFVQT